MGRHIVLALLSVRLCPSVRPSVCPSNSFEPLVGFTNNFAQMSSMMRRCAVPLFDQGRFKVKVTIKVLTLFDCISCLHISFEPLVGFTNNFAQMSSMMRRCAVPMFDQGGVKVTI